MRALVSTSYFIFCPLSLLCLSLSLSPFLFLSVSSSCFFSAFPLAGKFRRARAGKGRRRDSPGGIGPGSQRVMQRDQALPGWGMSCKLDSARSRSSFLQQLGSLFRALSSRFLFATPWEFFSLEWLRATTPRRILLRPMTARDINRLSAAPIPREWNSPGRRPRYDIAETFRIYQSCHLFLALCLSADERRVSTLLASWTWFRGRQFIQEKLFSLLSLVSQRMEMRHNSVSEFRVRRI